MITYFDSKTSGITSAFAFCRGGGGGGSLRYGESLYNGIATIVL